jgi:hypothetical protein
MTYPFNEAPQNEKSYPSPLWVEETAPMTQYEWKYLAQRLNPNPEQYVVGVDLAAVEAEAESPSGKLSLIDVMLILGFLFLFALALEAGM